MSVLEGESESETHINRRIGGGEVEGREEIGREERRDG